MTDIPQIFDTRLLKERRVRAYRKFGRQGDFLLTMSIEDLLDRLAITLRPFPKCVELGGHSGILAQALSKREGTESVMRLEQDPVFFQPEDAGLVMESEELPLEAESINLLVSPLYLHWINDLPGLLHQIRQSLAPDGLLLASLLGRESLRELRQAFLMAESELKSGSSPHVSPFPDVRDMGTLLQRAGFALPVVDHDLITVRYDTMFDLMRDLRFMGATNVLHERSRTPLRKDILYRAAEIYRDTFSEPDGRLVATFQILYLSGWSPHESQQKPLAPGSAQQSLATALGDKSAE
ncbi:methyltransferase domain-containing protein [uncultured Cohaesibacter sp.]|uniref:methyltransferase domain-containing protein n=1 Tax=uncultured Cohaesibacter sp. TaxID=1002546 RepID=UPI0029304323|nr:methyltransferase domain-containing protein [uncultured Cohaesibacter sp.]